MRHIQHMYVKYDDILDRISKQPIWWFDGMPRYKPFHPRFVGVYVREVALVHTECQDCGTRYDVAVTRERCGSLRDSIAYSNETPIGDPPNACPNPSNLSHAGACMSASQIAVLEYWSKPKLDWERDRSMERFLADAEPRHTGGALPEPPVFRRIHDSDRKDEWMQAQKDGDFSTMEAILREFGCERPAQVAHMIDFEIRERAFFDEMIELRRVRVGAV